MIEVAYQHRKRIFTGPDVTSEAVGRGWNNVYPSYLGINLFGSKRG